MRYAEHGEHPSNAASLPRCSSEKVIVVLRRVVTLLIVFGTACGDAKLDARKAEAVLRAELPTVPASPVIAPPGRLQAEISVPHDLITFSTPGLRYSQTFNEVHFRMWQALVERQLATFEDRPMPPGYVADIHRRVYRFKPGVAGYASDPKDNNLFYVYPTAVTCQLDRVNAVSQEGERAIIDANYACTEKPTEVYNTIHPAALAAGAAEHCASNPQFQFCWASRTPAAPLKYDDRRRVNVRRWDTGWRIEPPSAGR